LTSIASHLVLGGQQVDPRRLRLSIRCLPDIPAVGGKVHRERVLYMFFPAPRPSMCADHAATVRKSLCSCVTYAIGHAGVGRAVTNKKALSESDICDRFITPAVTRAGWAPNRWRREYGFTDGKIIVRGKLVARGKRKRLDYLLFHTPNLPIALIEAKDNNHSVGSGMQQASPTQRPSTFHSCSARTATGSCSTIAPARSRRSSRP